MLQDLRAIIVNNKLYKPKQQSSWYTRLICEREKEAVTINGKLNGAEILKNLIENDAKIKQMVFSHKNPLTKKMVTYFKTEVEIITGKDGKITESRYEHGITYTGNRDYKIHYEAKVPSYPMVKLLSKISDRILELMEKTIVTPERQKCESKKSLFNFIVEFKK
jgi:hypothetical protein